MLRRQYRLHAGISHLRACILSFLARAPNGRMRREALSQLIAALRPGSTQPSSSRTRPILTNAFRATLSRTLRRLRAKGWIEDFPGFLPRMHEIGLTPTGKAAFEKPIRPRIDRVPVIMSNHAGEPAEESRQQHGVGRPTGARAQSWEINVQRR